MRVISVLSAAGTLASCTMSDAPPDRHLASEREYQQLIAGKVAQAPITCLPHYLSGDMRVINDETLAFRNGNARVYIAHMQGSCLNLSEGHNALVTHQYGNAQLCRGDIGRVVDTLNGFTVGSCVFGDFVPFVRPGS